MFERSVVRRQGLLVNKDDSGKHRSNKLHKQSQLGINYFGF